MDNEKIKFQIAPYDGMLEGRFEDGFATISDYTDDTFRVSAFYKGECIEIADHVPDLYAALDAANAWYKERDK